MAKLDVLSIGSATHDLFLESTQFRIIPDPSFSTGEAECFALGSKLEIPRVTDELGGAGTNTSVGFARLGLRAGAAVRIGADGWGRELVQRLRAAKVRVLPRVDTRERTGIAVLLLTKRGERTVLIHRGASAHFTAVDVPAVRADWYYITSLAGSHPALTAILQRARRTNARVAWNPGQKELAWGFRRIRPLLKDVVIALNQFEAQRLTGGRNARDTARALVRAGAATALITQGKDGAVADDGRTVFRSGTHPIRVIDTTGAGDAFGCGFVAALIRERSIPEALQLATANSESVIRHVGAQPGLRRTFPRPQERVRVESWP